MTTAAEAPTAPVRAGRTAGTAVAVATAVCAALVLYQLGHDSLWTDETFSIGTIDRPLGDALWRIGNWELNQSPYLLLLSGWYRVGQSEGFLGLLSAGFAVASVPMVYLAGRRLFDERVGAVAAVLLAVHPLLIQQAQQLRAYSMLVFTTTATVLALCRLVERPGSGRAVTFALVAALTCYTHFSTLLVLGALAFSLVALPRERWRSLTRPLLVAGGVLAVALAPLAWYLVDREGDPLAWLAGQRESIVLATGRRLLGAGLPAAGAFVVALAVAAWASVGLWRRHDAPPTQTTPTAHTAPSATVPEGSELARWHLAACWSWLAVPFAVATTVTLTVKPILESKYLIGLVPVVVILAAFAITSIPSRWWAGALLVVLVAASVRSDLAWYRTESFDDWRSAAQILEAGPDAQVLPVPSREGTHALRYYLAQFGGDPGALVPPDGSLSPDRDLWVVTRPASGVRPGDERVLAEVAQGFRAVETIDVRGLELTRYVPDR
jgi:4-amino-4-deoxy-L-arabinose transferase-like glycosyltransferase